MARERPIIFKAEMIRAINEDRKGQTRRLRGLDRINEDPDAWRYMGVVDGAHLFVGGHGAIEENVLIACPYGTPGETLWVKEALIRIPWEGYDGIAYEADNEPAWDMTRPCAWGWKRNRLAGMFCPKGLSRITLELTEVRVERVQDISKEDAIAEGLRQNDLGQWLPHYPSAAGWEDPRQAFWGLWDSINEKRGYASMTVNPWVWVVSFRKV
jgi:hypothetical protein